jgi:uncharacterized protein (DUF4415 family)
MSKKNNIVRVCAEDLRAGVTDWAAVDALTDEEIEAAIASDPDAAPELDDEWFRNAVLVRPGKVATSLRVDDDVIGWFRSQGKGWQTRMNGVLRAYARAHGGVK